MDAFTLLPSDLFLLEHLDASSGESPRQQRRRLFKYYVELGGHGRLPYYEAFEKKTYTSSTPAQLAFLKDARTTYERKAANLLHNGNCSVYLRTFYGEGHNLIEDMDEQEIVAVTNIAEKQLIFDNEAYSFGTDWQQFFEVMPEILDPGRPQDYDARKKTIGEAKREAMQEYMDWHSGEIEELEAEPCRESDSEPEEPPWLAEVHQMCKTFSMYIQDRKSAKDRTLPLIWADDRGRVVRKIRVSFDRVVDLRGALFDGVPLLGEIGYWDNATVGAEYEIGGPAWKEYGLDNENTIPPSIKPPDPQVIAIREVFDQLRNITTSTHSTDEEYIQCLRRLGRLRRIDTVEPFITTEDVDVLANFAFKNESKAVAGEALSHVGILLGVQPHARRVFVDLGHVVNVAELLKSDSIDHELACSKILTLLIREAFLKKWRSNIDVPAVLADHNLAKSITQHLKHHAETWCNTTDLFVKPFSPEQRQHFAFMNTLELLTNILQQYPTLVPQFNLCIHPLIDGLKYRFIPQSRSRVSPNLGLEANVLRALGHFDFSAYACDDETLIGTNSGPNSLDTLETFLTMLKPALESARIFTTQPKDDQAASAAELRILQQIYVYNQNPNVRSRIRDCISKSDAITPLPEQFWMQRVPSTLEMLKGFADGKMMVKGESMQMQARLLLETVFRTNVEQQRGDAVSHDPELDAGTGTGTVQMKVREREQQT